MVESGKSLPDLLKGFDRDSRPSQGFAHVAYLDAWYQLSPLRPIPFTELQSYHEHMPVPFSLAVFIRVMRGLEADDAKKEADRIKNMNNKP